METHVVHFRKKLADEQALLIEELKLLGRINPDNPKDWEPVAADLNVDPAENEERAAEITSFEERSATEYEIEERLREVHKALHSLEDGTYGMCRTCGTQISLDRLEANAAATTCKIHLS